MRKLILVLVVCMFGLAACGKTQTTETTTTTTAPADQASTTTTTGQ